MVGTISVACTVPSIFTSFFKPGPDMIRSPLREPILSPGVCIKKPVIPWVSKLAPVAIVVQLSGVTVGYGTK